MSENTTRRFFLGAASAASAMRVWGANERINVAIVGLGGRGSNHLSIYSKLTEARVAALSTLSAGTMKSFVDRDLFNEMWLQKSPA